MRLFRRWIDERLNGALAVTIFVSAAVLVIFVALKCIWRA